MSRDTGGPYHPIKDYQMNDFNGLTLRDHFAGLAMQGLIANPTAIKDIGSTFGSEHVLPAIAKMAYAQADAMIAERSK